MSNLTLYVLVLLMIDFFSTRRADDHEAQLKKLREEVDELKKREDERPPYGEITDEICRCNHTRTDHFDYAHNYRPCLLDGCGCRKFTWAKWVTA